MWLSWLAAGLVAAAPGVQCPKLVPPPPPALKTSLPGMVPEWTYKEDKPTQHVPFPKGDESTASMKFVRGPCLGACPTYSVQIAGDGTVKYAGTNSVLVQGEHAYKIQAEEAKCVLDYFKQVDFWSLKDVYMAGITDISSSAVSLSFGNKSKTVVDYAGVSVGMPMAVVALEHELDEFARRWVYGDENTVPELKAAGFDFHSDAGARLLAGLVDRGPDVASLCANLSSGIHESRLLRVPVGRLYQWLRTDVGL